MKIVGLFVEPRKLKQIYYNIENFFEVLPNSKLYFYCGNGFLQYYKKLEDKYKLLIVRELRDTTDLNALKYSQFFVKKSLWESLDGDYCLTIQTDGCLCKNSNFKIEDFLKYDYIGPSTYIKYRYLYFCKRYKQHFINGGFSFRKISTMIDIIDRYKTPIDSSAACDYYFYEGCKHLNYKIANDDDRFGLNFGIQTSFNPSIKAFCIHKFAYFNKTNEILKYCPEYKYFIAPIKEKAESTIITNQEILYAKRYQCVKRFVNKYKSAIKCVACVPLIINNLYLYFLIFPFLLFIYYIELIYYSL